MDQDDHDRLVRLEARFTEYREAIAHRVSKLNELHEMVGTDRQVYLRTDVYNVEHSRLDDKFNLQLREARQVVDLIESRMTIRQDQLERRMANSERWQSWIVGAGATLVLVASILSVVLDHFWR